MDLLSLTLPAYYFENDYIDKKITQIKAAIAEAADPDPFFFISDMHWDQNQRKSPALIKYISDRVSIPRLFNCGDDWHMGLQQGENRSAAHEALGVAFVGKRYHTCGNHEYMFGTPAEAAEEAFAVDDDPDVTYGSRARCYYYVDNVPQKTRYIILNGWASQNGNEKWRSVAGFEPEQVAWLRDTALNVDDGWTILIFLHCFFGMPSVLNKPCKMVEWNVSGAWDVIEQYSGKGKIAAIFQGHTHRDRVAYIGEIPVIIITCNHNNPWTEPGGIPDIDVDRTKGTIRENAFDVCIFDRISRKITCIRIGGAAKDNAGNEVETRIVEY